LRGVEYLEVCLGQSEPPHEDKDCNIGDVLGDEGSLDFRGHSGPRESPESKHARVQRIKNEQSQLEYLDDTRNHDRLILLGNVVVGVLNDQVFIVCKDEACSG